MPRTQRLNDLMRAWRLATWCEATRTATPEALARRDEARARAMTRREWLGLTGAAAVAAASPLSAAPRPTSAPRIAIVGAGLAGLACAERLQRKGYSAVIYDASARVGGRVFSNRSLVAGMACENGGELIDTGHKTMLGYTHAFGLTVESYIRKDGETTYWFKGRSWPEAEVVEQFRAVVSRMQRDLRQISGAATADAHNDADVFFDQMDLASYFASRMAGFPLIEAALNEAYVAEYGLETSEQSALNFLGVMRLNKQSKFEPFGVSDERYHLLDGNDGIVRGLADAVSGPVVGGARLTRLTRTASGEYRLYFNGSTVAERAHRVVLALPFSVLRLVALDPSLGLDPAKRRAIDTLGYGTNAKTMIAFNGRPWFERYGANGTVFSDLAHVQTTWESNRGRSISSGIITDYASGNRGAALNPAAVQTQVSAFLADFDVVLPGTRAAASEQRGRYVAHLEHWPSNPNVRGSYTCYRPGQFTTVAGLEGPSVGGLKFAGEHADSFYSWQGYMEGACLSGIRAANEILDEIRRGAL